MVIDVITDLNTFVFYDFSIAVENFQANFLHGVQKNFSHFVSIEFLPIIVPFKCTYQGCGSSRMFFAYASSFFL